MQTVALHGHFVTTFTFLAAPEPPSEHLPLAPGVGVVLLLVVVLLRWSFRSLGRMFSDLVALFRVVVNLALIALMLVLAFAGIAALAFISAGQQ
jgi:hypothetical protein